MKLYNSQGELITLSQHEQKICNANEKAVNALGYEISITTLTTIMKKISEQKFFELAPADYMPVKVGEGAWSTNLTTYRSFMLADDFSTGVIGLGSQNGRLAVGDAGVDSLVVKVSNWAKQIGWTLFELQQASKSGNWDIVAAKEKSRKKNWDLGIQKVAFLGLAGDSSTLGLLTQTGITTDLTTITQPISAMTPAQLKTFTQVVLDKYRANCQRTAWPTHFTIPESDYNGLASQASADFPIKSTLQLLEEAFQTITRNKSFQILPCAYGDAAYNTLGVQKYALYNSDEESLRIDIPVDYTNTLANSIDNFSFQNVGYGQFTGALAYRPQELLYFQY